MRIVTVVGARPQFVKAAPVSARLRLEHQEILVHTGQHYDEAMSDLLFRQLGIPEPDFNLGVGSSTHAVQTAAALTGLEAILLEQRPDAVLVYGDTNSTLAGALAAVKLHIPLVHVEAGLRSFNRAMPEEVNRVVTDHVATLLLAPTRAAMENLRQEGLESRAQWVGDVMYDCALRWLPVARERFAELGKRLGVEARDFSLATIHRAENTDDETRLGAILGALIEAGEPIVLPLHPRTQRTLGEGPLGARVEAAANLRIIPPVGYLEMLALEANARRIVTDSGGVQKEGYFVATPVITVRDETEWVETVEAGWNVVVGADRAAILAALREPDRARSDIAEYGAGDAAGRIVELIAALPAP